MKKTTHPPLLDITEYFPEFRGKQKSAILLHPRRAKGEMELLASKFGGPILWPENEEWPFCSHHGVPYQPVIQLSKTDFPEVGFWNGTDLFQILWCPHSHEENEWLPARKIYWRCSREIDEFLYPNPKVMVNSSFLHTDKGKYLPTSCYLNPERVIEYPDFNELPDELRYKIEQWNLPSSPAIEEWLKRENKYYSGTLSPSKWLYICDLSISSGSKLGGYPGVILQYPDYPICRCGRKMDLFITISSIEPGHHHQDRWTPIEEENLSDVENYQIYRATGLDIGDGGFVSIYICRHCQEWPMTFVNNP